LADRTEADKYDRAARVISWLFRPFHSLIAAAIVAAGATAAPNLLPTALGTLALFCVPALVVLGLARRFGGGAPFSRRRTVPQLLAAYVLTLAIVAPLSPPEQVVRAYAVYFVVGVVAAATARTNVSAHCLMAGAAVGLMLGWFPTAGLLALPALSLLAWSRVRLHQHTAAQALAGALCGVGLGLIGSLA
jgi:membrane-associated phospholipid phosphatase